MSWGNNGANLLRPHSWFGLESPISPSDNLFKMTNKKPKTPDIPKPVTLPDATDAAVRRRQAEELKSLLKRRGRSRTFLSGRAGDQSQAPARSTIVGRG